MKDCTGITIVPGDVVVTGMRSGSSMWLVVRTVACIADDGRPVLRNDKDKCRAYTYRSGSDAIKVITGAPR